MTRFAADVTQSVLCEASDVGHLRPAGWHAYRVTRIALRAGSALAGSASQRGSTEGPFQHGAKQTPCALQSTGSATACVWLAIPLGQARVRSCHALARSSRRYAPSYDHATARSQFASGAPCRELDMPVLPAVLEAVDHAAVKANIAMAMGGIRSNGGSAWVSLPCERSLCSSPPTVVAGAACVAFFVEGPWRISV